MHPRDNIGRRDEDGHWIKRLYARYHLAVGMAGIIATTFTLLASLIAMVVLVQKAQAFDSRLTDIEQAQHTYNEDQKVINGKLNTILYFVSPK